MNEQAKDIAKINALRSGFSVRQHNDYVNNQDKACVNPVLHPLNKKISNDDDEDEKEEEPVQEDEAPVYVKAIPGSTCIRTTSDGSADFY